MGDEFLVNTYRAQWQQHPDTARLADGSFVVAWDSFFSEDFDRYYVGLQRYDAAGHGIGDELVRSDGGLEAINPRVTGLDGGGYAITYEASVGSISDRTDVFVAAFNANGRPRGAPARVNAPADDYFFGQEISNLPGGGFVAVYSGPERSSVGHFGGDGIYGRVFSASGEPEGRPFHIGQTRDFDQYGARAARLGTGETVVIWESEYSSINSVGTAVDDVRGRILGRDGRPSGPEFVVSPENDGMNGGFKLTETDISVEALRGGRFVAAWYDTVLHGRNGGKDTTYELHARIFGHDGTPQGRVI